MPTRPKRFAPAADRNREPIAAILRRVLPRQGLVLETASGTGQHAAYFAGEFPALTWQPSEADPEALADIEAWRAGAALPNLRSPVWLDVAGAWPERKVEAVLSINLVHISPWETTLGLFRGAGEVLVEGGLLFLYGPYFVAGAQTAPSNVDFDRSLRARDPRWGVRTLEAVRQAGRAAGFFLLDVFEMPANNLSLVFRKIPAPYAGASDDFLIAYFKNLPPVEEALDMPDR